MRKIFVLISAGFCLSGCSEMRVIGNAALRELRADAVSVNWNKSVEVKKTPAAQVQALMQTTTAREKTFSTFRKSPASKRILVTGLWEQKGR